MRAAAAPEALDVQSPTSWPAAFALPTAPPLHFIASLADGVGDRASRTFGKENGNEEGEDEEEGDGEKTPSSPRLCRSSTTPSSSPLTSSMVAAVAMASTALDGALALTHCASVCGETVELPQPCGFLSSASVSAPADRHQPAPGARRGTLILSHRRIERASVIEAPQLIPLPAATIWQTSTVHHSAALNGAERELPDRCSSSPSASSDSPSSLSRKSRRSRTSFRSSGVQQFAQLIPVDAAVAVRLPPASHAVLERSATFAHSVSLPCSRRPSYFDGDEEHRAEGFATPQSSRSRALRRAPCRVNWDEISRRTSDGAPPLPDMRWLSSEDRAFSAAAMASPALPEAGHSGRHPSLSSTEWAGDDLRSTSSASLPAVLPSFSPAVPIAVVGDSLRAQSVPTATHERSASSIPSTADSPRSCSTVSSGCSPSPRSAVLPPHSSSLCKLTNRPPSLPRSPYSHDRSHTLGGRGSTTAKLSPDLLPKKLSPDLISRLSDKVEQMQRFRGGLRFALIAHGEAMPAEAATSSMLGAHVEEDALGMSRLAANNAARDSPL